MFVKLQDRTHLPRDLLRNYSIMTDVQAPWKMILINVKLPIKNIIWQTISLYVPDRATRDLEYIENVFFFALEWKDAIHISQLQSNYD